jgi:hypothetical protein
MSLEPHTCAVENACKACADLTKLLKARARALDVARLSGHSGPISDARIIQAAASVEADRKAVALRVLDEIVVAWSNQPLSSKRPVLDAIDELRAKYKEAT